MLAEIKSRLLLPRSGAADAEEGDPRAELIRRLQEYERFKQAAEKLDVLPRLERDFFTASAELMQREINRIPPAVNLTDLLAALREVLQRAELYSHHRISHEPLSVRERMSRILEAMDAVRFTPFTALFTGEEGRMGVVVTFLAVLELLREALLELVQAAPFAPIHVRLRT
jgi:segregation and condensation protein A